MYTQSYDMGPYESRTIASNRTVLSFADFLQMTPKRMHRFAIEGFKSDMDHAVLKDIVLLLYNEDDHRTPRLRKMLLDRVVRAPMEHAFEFHQFIPEYRQAAQSDPGFAADTIERLSLALEETAGKIHGWHTRGIGSLPDTAAMADLETELAQFHAYLNESPGTESVFDESCYQMNETAKNMD
jgi:hypothetical protein